MYYDPTPSTLPKNFKERAKNADERRRTLGFDRQQLNDLKVTLEQSMYENEGSENVRDNRSRRSRNDPRRNTTAVTEYELRQNRINSPAVHTVKDQEWLIQDLKKENFDLKLRLFMEQKEREKLQNGTNRQTVDLEADLTEALDELEHAMDKENQLTNELSTARRREKTLSTKLKRLERICQQQEDDIIRMSLELENLKMEIVAKDSGIVSPNNLRNARLQSRGMNGNGGRVSPTSDLTDRYSDRLSAGYPDRYWDHYSDRGSDSGSYATTPKERKGFFNDRSADDMSTSDESEVRQRVALGKNQSDTERAKRREKLLSRRVKHYQEVEDNKELSNQEEGNNEHSRNSRGSNDSANLDTSANTPGYNERSVDVAPDLVTSSSERTNTGKKGFSRPRWFGKKQKGNKAKSKSMDELDTIGRVDIKNIHKKNKKYNFWGCVRARESINENIRSEYAPVKRPQPLQQGKKPTENNNTGVNDNNTETTASVDYI